MKTFEIKCYLAEKYDVLEAALYKQSHVLDGRFGEWLLGEWQTIGGDIGKQSCKQRVMVPRMDRWW